MQTSRSSSNPAEKTVESFVMVTKEDSEVSVISFDGKMDREQMENILAEAAR